MGLGLGLEGTGLVNITEIGYVEPYAEGLNSCSIFYTFQAFFIRYVLKKRMLLHSLICFMTDLTFVFQ